MTKDMTWVVLKVTISVLIIGLLNYYIISGANLSMQIGFVLLGVLIILNIFFNQSKKRIEKILYTLCAVLLMLIGARSYVMDSFEPYLDRATDITYEIRTSLKNANGDFSDMVIATGQHGWNRLYLLPPRTDINKFLKKNNLTWQGDKKENIKYQDDTALLIFTLGYKVSCYAEIKSEDSIVDFSEVTQVNNVTNSFSDD
ncbi:hypothetical protein Awo_c10020 [Acetobacterium woodii DSM 1030]|uniref:Uncharacterized protein n=2 Tax=Acetobacterium woodii TaxID=33952 RepID=H6LCK6_ACEWD|nr:hypothetical protein Awo_c10020 [Acetobacterium woodii DSM 1030]